MFSKEQFTTVTPLSKALAMIVFITLPFAAFFLGMSYGRQTLSLTQTIISPAANDVQEVDTSDWKTYRNEELGFEFKYPQSWGEVSSPSVRRLPILPSPALQTWRFSNESDVRLHVTDNADMFLYCGGLGVDNPCDFTNASQLPGTVFDEDTFCDAMRNIGGGYNIRIVYINCDVEGAIWGADRRYEISTVNEGTVLGTSTEYIRLLSPNKNGQVVVLQVNRSPHKVGSIDEEERYRGLAQTADNILSSFEFIKE